MRLFLCGDVMTGRGIDQILPTPCDPELFEAHARSALDYVALAERVSGPIPRGVGFDYVWGDALAAIERRAPDLRIVNLETSVTSRGKPESKAINYRMHPANLPCIAAARIDCCILANNHAGDFGRQGLKDTNESMSAAGIPVAGAGLDRASAERPFIHRIRDGKRVLVFAFAARSSGVPLHWAARWYRAGLNVLPDLGGDALARIGRIVARWRMSGDFVIVSMHWGPNWGYEVPGSHRWLAHALIDEAGVDLVYGHSSHHPMAAELHAGRAVLYGCGDFVNDYEGIGSHADYRPELVLGYFLEIDDSSHELLGLDMVPFRTVRFRLAAADAADVAWLADRLGREYRRFGLAVRLTGDNALAVAW